MASDLGLHCLLRSVCPNIRVKPVNIHFTSCYFADIVIKQIKVFHAAMSMGKTVEDACFS